MSPLNPLKALLQILRKLSFVSWLKFSLGSLKLLCWLLEVALRKLGTCMRKWDCICAVGASKHAQSEMAWGGLLLTQYRSGWMQVPWMQVSFSGHKNSMWLKWLKPHTTCFEAGSSVVLNVLWIPAPLLRCFTYWAAPCVLGTRVVGLLPEAMKASQAQPLDCTCASLFADSGWGDKCCTFPKPCFLLCPESLWSI